MSKYHVGPNGPGPCKAEKGNCPYGGESGEENHYNSMEEAEQAYEQELEESYGSFTTYDYDEFEESIDTSKLLIQQDKTDFFNGENRGEYLLVSTVDGSVMGDDVYIFDEQELMDKTGITDPDELYQELDYNIEDYTDHFIPIQDGSGSFRNFKGNALYYERDTGSVGEIEGLYAVRTEADFDEIEEMGAEEYALNNGFEIFDTPKRVPTDVRANISREYLPQRLKGRGEAGENDLFKTSSNSVFGSVFSAYKAGQEESGFAGFSEVPAEELEKIIEEKTGVKSSDYNSQVEVTSKQVREAMDAAYDLNYHPF